MRTVAPTPERRHHRWATIAGTTLVVRLFSETYFVGAGEFFRVWALLVAGAIRGRAIEGSAIPVP